MNRIVKDVYKFMTNAEIELAGEGTLVISNDKHCRSIYIVPGEKHCSAYIDFIAHHITTKYCKKNG